MSVVKQDTYWANNGKYNDFAAKLQKLIPVEGSVSSPGGRNKNLERFRKATNCYYDLYNNGLCNRARAFSKIFGIASSNYGFGNGRFSQNMYTMVEEKMDVIVENAAREQGFIS